MTLLETHLEQIALSASALMDLPFPAAKSFTNALLHPHDITALIRDTEAHERALFSISSAPDASTSKIGLHAWSRHNDDDDDDVSSRRNRTMTSHAARGRRRHDAVTAVLGGDMVARIHQAEVAGRPGRERGEVDVDLLLTGAERLCAVYPIPGASQRISTLRARHRRLSSSREQHERSVARLTGPSDRPYGPTSRGSQDPTTAQKLEVTEEDLEQVEAEIQALERKKREMDVRLSEMERDLGGLLR